MCKKSPKFSHWHISQSQWRNCGNIIVTIRWIIISLPPNYLESYFLQNWGRILWIIINFIKTIDIWFTNRTFWNISLLHIFAFIFWVDLMTLESLWRHKGVAMHVTYTSMHRFPTMQGSPLPLCNFACQFRLRNIWKPYSSHHNRI